MKDIVTIAKDMFEKITPDSVVYTDGFGAYNALDVSKSIIELILQRILLANIIT
jgi:transposase-like protein